jgi:tetratricopeptide (TPR) repeat protein
MATETASSEVSHRKRCLMENFLLIWIDPNIDPLNQDYQDKLTQLQNITNDVNVFNQRDECIDFLTNISNIKAFVIIDGNLCQTILPLIHDIPQLDNIYILCRNKSKHEEWTKAWMKVTGVHTSMSTICESIEKVVKQHNHNSIAMSIVLVDEVVSSQNLDQLEPSFMYTQLLKEILLGLDYNKRECMQNFIAFCRDGNHMSLTNLTRFERNYNSKCAIRWYTNQSSLYSMLNSALRVLDMKTIMKIAFYICDLHLRIETLYRQQVGSYGGKPFTIYRGQGLSKLDFDKLRKTRGGLISFNSFLSTSEDRATSLGFAEAASTNPNLVGILFQISIDPTISSAPFANIREESSFKQEEEILFSMHTVFRIGEITEIQHSSPFYEINLELTADDDPQIRTLTHRIREVIQCVTGLDQLVILLLKIGEMDMAEEITVALLKRESDSRGKALYYSNLAYIKSNQGDYRNALRYQEKELEILQKILPPTDRALAASHCSINVLHYMMGEYSKALLSHQKVLPMQQKTLPPNDPNLAISYRSLGTMYCTMGEHLEALSSCEKAIEIQQISLPPNDPELATSYNNIGLIYQKMGDYSKALSSHEKALEIRQKSLLPNHVELADSHNSIGLVYRAMGDNSKALLSHQTALEIQQKTLPSSHHELAVSNYNIGGVHYNMEEYQRALEFYECALSSFKISLPPHHPTIKSLLNDIKLAEEKYKSDH